MIANVNRGVTLGIHHETLAVRVGGTSFGDLMPQEENTIRSGHADCLALVAGPYHVEALRKLYKEMPDLKLEEYFTTLLSELCALFSPARLKLVTL